MIVNTPNGTADVAGNGKTNTALGFGIAGLAAALLGGGANVLGYVNQNAAANCPDTRPVTKAELDMSMGLSEKNLEIAKRDSLLAIKESESYTDKKIVEVYANLEAQTNRLSDKMEADRRAQEQFNAQQMAYNAAANASIDVLKSQTAALQSVTKLYIPSSNVCASGCGCACGNG